VEYGKDEMRNLYLTAVQWIIRYIALLERLITGPLFSGVARIDCEQDHDYECNCAFSHLVAQLLGLTILYFFFGRWGFGELIPWLRERPLIYKET
jgi:hypothetical protein